MKTVVTILNKFQEMMHHLGQKHVVIVGNQPPDKKSW